MWETWVRFLGQEDPLKKEMATHSRILAWRTPWTEEPGGLQSMGSQRSDTTWQLNCHEEGGQEAASTPSFVPVRHQSLLPQGHNRSLLGSERA